MSKRTNTTTASATTTTEATEEATVTTTDTTTTEPTTTALPSVADYRAADRKGKAAMKALVNGRMRAAVAAGDMAAWQEAAARLDAMTAPVKAAPAPVDAASVIAARVATLLAAADMLARGVVVPEGLDAGQVDFDTLPAGSADYTEALAIAGSRATRSDSHDIQAVFDRAFEGKPVGTVLTVAQICSGGALADYQPGSGAVAARLFPNTKRGCTLKGVVPVPETATGVKGARKVA